MAEEKDKKKEEPKEKKVNVFWKVALAGVLIWIMSGYFIPKPVPVKNNDEQRLSEGPVTKVLQVNTQWSGLIKCYTRQRGYIAFEAMTRDVAFEVRYNGGPAEGGWDDKVPAIRDRPPGWEPKAPPERIINARVRLTSKDESGDIARVSYTKGLE